MLLGIHHARVQRRVRQAARSNRHEPGSVGRRRVHGRRGPQRRRPLRGGRPAETDEPQQQPEQQAEEEVQVRRTVELIAETVKGLERLSDGRKLVG